MTYRQGSQGAMVKQIQHALHLYPDGIFGPATAEAVKEFQRANNLTADGIVGPATLAALIPVRLRKSKRKINEIIVHCTATPEGRNYTVEDIRHWHKQQGWSDIGYHYVVYRNGHVEPGRNVEVAGAHCTGHNSHSIGVVYVGGVSADGKTAKDTRTDEQKDALAKLLTELRIIYPDAKIYGHRNFANKACPSFDAKKAYSYI